MSKSKHKGEARAPRLGYVGLGIMGGAMCRNLLDAGHAVSVWNRTAEKAEALVPHGAALCDSPAAVAAQSDVVFLNVTDTADVEQVLFSVMGVAAGSNEKRGLVVVDHSTISPVATKDFAERLHEYGIVLLDAPVSGGDVGAKNGTLSIMVGGPPEVFEEVLPLLEVVGGAVTHVGPAGSGQVCKACNQVAVLGALLGATEALALSTKLGLDPAKMIEVVSAGAGGSWQLNKLGPKIVKGDLEPGFFVDYLLKDLGIVAESAAHAGLPLPVTSAGAQLMRAASARGLGKKGTQAVSAAVEALGGFSFADAAVYGEDGETEG